MVGAQGTGCWRCGRQKTAPQLHSFRRPPLPTCLRERPSHKGRGRELESCGRRVTRLGPKEGGWLEPVGLGAQSDPALMRRIPRRLAGPDSSPWVPAVPSGAPSARLGPQVSLAQRCRGHQVSCEPCLLALGEGARCLQQQVTESGRVGARTPAPAMEGTQRGAECEMHRFGTTGAPPWTTGQWGSRLGWKHPLCVTSARSGGDSRVLAVHSCVSREASCENPVQDATPAQSGFSLGACAPGGQLDSLQGLRDHSWSGFVSALNLGSPFVKAVARGRNGGNSTGSALVGLGQIAEAGDPRVWCPDDSRPALAFSLGTSTTGVVPWHRRKGRRRGRESRTVLILQERKLGLGLDLESCLKS